MPFRGTFLGFGLLVANLAQAAPRDLAEMSLEELADVEVTSVSRKSERQLDAAAAIFVITQNDIRRSGVTSIPEALRLAPGVEVARVTSNKWAIGVRGFGSTLSRSLLVLVDGRSVYQPLFAGVYWEEQQDLVLEDIERIEVILGPGGTLWGANAVNGVINIITKSADNTQGLMAKVGGGNVEQGFASIRYGGKIGEDLYYRVFAKFFERGPEFHPNGDKFDDWRVGSAGTRIDWAPRRSDRLMLSADFYLGTAGQPPTTISATDQRTGDADLFGGHVLGRWLHTFNRENDLTVQAYYYRNERHDLTFIEDRDTIDVEAQHRARLPWHQELVWGLEYRLSTGKARSNQNVLRIVPQRRTDQLFTGFIQDEVAVVPQLRFIAGIKLEHNDYSGFEYQPTGRVIWTPKWMALWAAVSRAVRTPSRVEHDLEILAPSTTMPATVDLIGNKKFHSEEVIAYELGYRMQPVKQVFLNLAGFYNQYFGLLSVESGTPVMQDSQTIIPYSLANGFNADVAGFEGKIDLQPISWLGFHGSYSYLYLDMKRRAGSDDMTTEKQTQGSSPHHQVTVWPQITLPWRIELDAVFRWVSALPAQKVDDYVNLDVRIAYRPIDKLELAVVGQDLLQMHHFEFAGASPNATAVRRSIYGKVTWGF